jgi:Uma2 family endonuclease
MAERQTMPESARLVTAEELERFPDDDYRYELVEGRVIRMSPVGWQHGRMVVRLATLLNRHVDDRNLGVVVTEVGFKLASNPDTVRGPDLAFVRHERIPPEGPRGFWQGPPDLVVEVLSPDDRGSEVRAKVGEYLQSGVTVVVVVDPDDETVSVSRRLSPTLVLSGDDAVLEVGDLLPGFSCTLRQIFK